MTHKGMHRAHVPEGYVQSGVARAAMRSGDHVAHRLQLRGCVALRACLRIAVWLVCVRVCVCVCVSPQDGLCVL